MIILGLFVGYICAAILVTTKSPSIMLPISALGAVAGVALTILGIFY